MRLIGWSISLKMFERKQRPYLPAVLLTILLSSSLWAQEPVQLTANVHTPFTFVAYGDLREAPVANTKDTDPVRRKALIDAITQTAPAFVLVSGDLPLRGDNSNDWAQWDKETRSWQDAKISVYPAIGNHELRGDETVALNNYFQRFPYLKQNRYYSVRAGNLLILSLDSTQNVAEGPQMQWLSSQLKQIPSDVDFIVINMHHPAYTHSTDEISAGGHSPRASEQQFAKYLEQTQQHTRARMVVFAGHVHNYERYEHGGVMYIVSGGAGAKWYEIPRLPDDFYKDSGPTYHYCLLTSDKGRLEFSMMKLEMKGDRATFAKRDSFTVMAAKGAAAGAKK